MKKGVPVLLLLVMTLAFGMTVQAKGEDTVKNGVYAGTIDLSGKTRIEATAAIEAYVDELKQVEITLLAADNKEVITTAEELGIIWENTDIVTEALELGSHGNIIERYKTLKDLEHEKYTFPLEFTYDFQAISNLLTEKAAKYDQKAINVSLKRENGQFQVVAGQTGYLLDVETSIDLVYDYLTEEWDHKPCRIALDIIIDEPKGSAEELSVVQDILGTFTTSFASSNVDRSANVENGSRLINAITLYPGEEFSMYKEVAPFTVQNGYYMAGSYVNGKVVDSLGGGICQVSTTLYNAVLKAELDVTERHNHSMIVAYAEPSADAAIAESSGKDFRFVNNTDYPIYVESTTKDKRITVSIYGKETRDASRKVRYESEILEVINPSTDQIYADASLGLGYVKVENAHIGYKARLWKVVTENGEEVSREQVNKSNYKMTPRSAVVGTATADPNAYNEVMAAIGTSNIDHVRNVVAQLIAPPQEDDDDDEDE